MINRRKLLKWILYGGAAALIPRCLLTPNHGDTFLSNSGEDCNKESIKVMSWNVASWRRRSLSPGEAMGLTSRDISQTCDQALEYILEEDPDILMTQEDTSGYLGNNNFNSVDRIDDEFNSVFFGKLFNYGYLFGAIPAGNFGNAIYSKYPLHNSRMFNFLMKCLLLIIH